MTDHSKQHSPHVLVMMATYNGQEYLEQQVDSILAQTDVQVSLCIRDDCSQDNTPSILQAYENSDDRVHVIQNDRNLGAGQNFLEMVYDSSDEYDFYAFSDQDDYWLPNKLHIACDALLEYPKEEPCLYFSSFYNCDSNLENPHEEISLFKACDGRPGTVLVRNWAHGCTMVFNRSLRDLLCAYKTKSILRLHDTWVHMVAKYCGTVIPDYENKTLLRRIHGNNVEGSVLKNYSTPKNAINALRQAFEPTNRCWTNDALLLNEGYGNRIRPEMRPHLERFLHYSDSISNRIRIACDEAFRMPTVPMRMLSAYFALFKRW